MAIEQLEIKLAFYIGKGDSKFSRFVIPLIRFWDKNLISHSEIIFTDESGVEHWISARPGGVTDQVNYSYDPAEWIFATIPISKTQFNRMEEFVKTKVLESGYDWIGIIFSAIIPIRFESKKNWFCSELCRATLRSGKISDIDWSIPDHMVTPAELFQEVKGHYMSRLTFPNELFEKHD